MGFALCCGIFCALPASLIRSSTVVHSLISLLAKRKISAHHFAKSSSTMPGIFLYTERSCFAGARLAVVAARVEYGRTLPLRTPRQNPPGCARSLRNQRVLGAEEFVCRVLVVRRKRSPAAQGAAAYVISKDGTRGGGDFCVTWSGERKSGVPPDGGMTAAALQGTFRQLRDWQNSNQPCFFVGNV